MQHTEVISRQFIEKGGRIRHCTPQKHAAADRSKGERSFSAYSTFSPGFDPEAIKKAIDKREFRSVQVYTSQDPVGVWLIGGCWWLEQAIATMQKQPIEM